MPFARFSALFSIVAALLLCGCGDEPATAPGGAITVSAGLPPIAYIANRIGGDFIHAKSVLPEGRSPHDYSPGPHDIRAAAASKLFLTTRMPFDNRSVMIMKSDPYWSTSPTGTGSNPFSRNAVRIPLRASPAAWVGCNSRMLPGIGSWGSLARISAATPRAHNRSAVHKTWVSPSLWATRPDTVTDRPPE